MAQPFRLSSAHAAITLRIATGTSNLGKVKNNTVTWEELATMLATPTVTKETLKAYLKLPKERQDELKNVNGYWIGGHCDDGRRAASKIKERDVLTLDIDDAPADLTNRLKAGLSGISHLEWYGHSTRKHTPENPRVRITIPFKQPIPAEKYMPVARIIASQLDPSMDAIDDASYRVTQMMFLPSCSTDSEFWQFHNAGELLDADGVLDAFGDWRDYRDLPYSKRHGQKRPSAKEAEDPRKKKGKIGAFCRARDIPTIIADFLSDVYIPGDYDSGNPRYTFAGGTTSNGAVVLRDGLFLYSFHATDPCSECFVNGFDLVRIHKYRHLDGDTTDQDQSPTKLPSYKAMMRFLDDDLATIEELAADHYDLKAMFEDVDAEDDEMSDSSEHFGKQGEPERADPLQQPSGGFQYDPDIEELLGSATPGSGASKRPKGPPRTETWFPQQLELKQDGSIKATLTNVAVIVQNDARLWGVIARNEFTGQIVACRSLKSKMAIVPSITVSDPANGVLWDDVYDASVRAIIEAPNGRGKAGYGVKISDRDLREAIILAAQKNKFHPIRDYFNGLTWDGTARLEMLLIRYLGCPDTPYHRETIKLALLAAVVRTFEPGHKFDTALILEGSQGVGKSTFIKVLARHEWFSELHGDMGDQQKMVEQMMGFLILELPELAGLRKSEVDDTKSFLSRTEDTVRLAYDKRATTMKRQCVFFGTTNDAKYLKDTTGNRRFWPVKVNVDWIDLAALDPEMDQVWAETVALYRSMREAQPRGTLPLYLTSQEARAEALVRQEAARLESADEGQAGAIQEWLDTPVPLSKVLGGLDEQFNEENDKLVLRMVTCQKQVWIEALGGSEASYSQQTAQTLGRSMQLLAGWKQGGRQRIRRWGIQRIYVRDGVSPADVQRGYVVVEDDGIADLL